MLLTRICGTVTFNPFPVRSRRNPAPVQRLSAGHARAQLTPPSPPQLMGLRGRPQQSGLWRTSALPPPQPALFSCRPSSQSRPTAVPGRAGDCPAVDCPVHSCRPRSRAEHWECSRSRMCERSASRSCHCPEVSVLCGQWFHWNLIQSGSHGSAALPAGPWWADGEAVGGFPCLFGQPHCPLLP